MVFEFAGGCQLVYFDDIYFNLVVWKLVFTWFLDVWASWDENLVLDCFMMWNNLTTFVFLGSWLLHHVKQSHTIRDLRFVFKQIRTASYSQDMDHSKHSVRADSHIYLCPGRFTYALVCFRQHWTPECVIMESQPLSSTKF